MKTFCILQVAPVDPNPEHVLLFSEKQHCDFHFVTHDKMNIDAMRFCPGTTWAETRNILVESVFGGYEYYGFADYDYEIEVHTGRGVVDQIMFDLERWQPATASYYPGRHVNHGFPKEHRASKEYSCWPFLHVAFRFVHKSLMPWFFPMVTAYDGGWSACQAFNIMELPFIKNCVLFHGMTYHNTRGVAAHSNSDDCWDNMHHLWQDMNTAIKWDRFSLLFGEEWKDLLEISQQSPDSRTIKQSCLHIAKTAKFEPEVGDTTRDYLADADLDSLFVLKHPIFVGR